MMGELFSEFQPGYLSCVHMLRDVWKAYWLSFTLPFFCISELVFQAFFLRNQWRGDTAFKWLVNFSLFFVVQLFHVTGASGWVSVRQRDWEKKHQIWEVELSRPIHTTAASSILIYCTWMIDTTWGRIKVGATFETNAKNKNPALWSSLCIAYSCHSCSTSSKVDWISPIWGKTWGWY